MSHWTAFWTLGERGADGRDGGRERGKQKGCEEGRVTGREGGWEGWKKGGRGRVREEEKGGWRGIESSSHAQFTYSTYM